MARKRYTPEQIIRLLKETEVLSRRCSTHYLKRKYLWSDGGKNIII